ncbi:hypothetical protein F5Y14DRAFT_364957 [Nemania sp. NC0429]|nr:hypothetical protein F5Y14DRAFT_364957 [Nemania sp. NC0429]
MYGTVWSDPYLLDKAPWIWIFPNFRAVGQIPAETHVPFLHGDGVYQGSSVVECVEQLRHTTEAKTTIGPGRKGADRELAVRRPGRGRCYLLSHGCEGVGGLGWFSLWWIRDGRCDNSIIMPEPTMTGEQSWPVIIWEPRGERGWQPRAFVLVRGGSTENVKNAKPSWLILLRRFDAAKCLSPPDCIQPRSVHTHTTGRTRV